MQTDRGHKCIRRRTLAVLPICGLPFPDHQPSKQPATSIPKCTSATSTTRKFAGQQSRSDCQLPPAGDDCNRFVATCCDETSLSDSRKSGGHLASGLSWSATKQHRAGSKILNSTPDGTNVANLLTEELLEYSDECCHSHRQSYRTGRTSSGTPTIAVTNQQRWLGRTPSWPSALLRVKERLLEKVYVTSSEWPHAAAIERERRQRAARAFQLTLQGAASKLSSESSVNCVTGSATRLSPSPVSSNPVSSRLQQQQHVADKRRVRIQSEPQTAVGPSASTALLADGEDSSADRRRHSKLAFRRRSISEDTCDRPPPSSSCRNGRNVAAVTSSGASSGAGIICSDDDLRAIVYEHRRRQSSSLNARSPSATAFVGELPPFETETDDRVTFDIGSPCDGEETPLNAANYSPLPSPLESATGSVSLAFCRQDDPNDATLQQQQQQQLQQPRVVTSQPLCNNMGGHRPSTQLSAAQQHPVPEVVYDEYGQTWDVYGAEFDPEILGRAIQVHLEKMMATASIRKFQQQKQQMLLGNNRVRMVPRCPLQVVCVSEQNGTIVTNCRLVSEDGRANRLMDFITKYLCSSWHRTASGEQSPMTTNI